MHNIQLQPYSNWRKWGLLPNVKFSPELYGNYNIITLCDKNNYHFHGWLWFPYLFTSLYIYEAPIMWSTRIVSTWAKGMTQWLKPSLTTLVLHIRVLFQSSLYYLWSNFLLMLLEGPKCLGACYPCARQDEGFRASGFDTDLAFVGIWEASDIKTLFLSLPSSSVPHPNQSINLGEKEKEVIMLLRLSCFNAY